MLRLVESIRLDNGKVSAEMLPFHQERMERTFKELFPGSSVPDLKTEIENFTSGKMMAGVWKCRVIYTNKIEEIQAAVYHKKKINSLKLVSGEGIDYHIKYLDKTWLDTLKKSQTFARFPYFINRQLIGNLAKVKTKLAIYRPFIYNVWSYYKFPAQRSQSADADDILIVQNGLITDASYANAVFFDGKNWFTPDTPLLRGTRRESLIRAGKISEKKISADSVFSFKSVKLINAMIPFEEAEELGIELIQGK